jgi:hypothetical protein
VVSNSIGAGGLVEVEDIFIVLAKRKGVDRWFFWD